jgi:hypothetical protein
VGQTASASPEYLPFANNDVEKRHALEGGDAVHTPSTSSIDRAKHFSLVHSMLTGPPPLTPPSQGGERRGRARGICATNSERLFATLTGPPPLHKGGKEEGACAEFAQPTRNDCSRRSSAHPPTLTGGGRRRRARGICATSSERLFATLIGPPPLTPLHKGGKEEGALVEFVDPAYTSSRHGERISREIIALPLSARGPTNFSALGSQSSGMPRRSAIAPR